VDLNRAHRRRPGAGTVARGQERKWAASTKTLSPYQKRAAISVGAGRNLAISDAATYVTCDRISVAPRRGHINTPLQPEPLASQVWNVRR